MDLTRNPVACSKRSDSGERREFGKRVKKRGEIGERACPSIFPRLFRMLFSAPLPYSSRLPPLSERLEQASNPQPGGPGD